MQRLVPVVVLSGILAVPAYALTIGSDWRIVVPADGDPGVRAAICAAASELQEDLRLGAGLELPVVGPDKAGAPAIHLGADAAAKAGFDLSGLAYHDNVVAEKGGSVYLFGPDRPGRTGRRGLAWTGCTLPTVRAVARFLEKSADVVFLAPGRLGKDVPKVGKVELADGTLDVEKATQIAGSGFGSAGMMYAYANGFYGQGVFHSYGGHSYPAACPTAKYFQEHPEYFALLGGRRAESAENALCVSNPDVQQLIFDELIRRFDEGADVVQLAQQDGSDWCQCDKCRAFFGNDVGEALWRLHRDLAERALRVRPGKTVNILSYGPTVRPPRTFRKFPANVMVELAASGERDFARWEGYEVPRGFGVYVYNWGCYPQPDFTAKQSMARMAVQARRFVKHNVRYVYRCGYGELYGMEGPAYWIFNRVLAAPETDVRRAFEDYCRHAYGPAAAPMRTFHLELDAKLRRDFGVNEPRIGQEDANGLQGLVDDSPRTPWDLLAYVYSPDTLRRTEECLARAEKTAGLDERQAKRIELVRREFDYAANLGRIAYLYGAYRLKPTQPLFDALADEIVWRNGYLARTYGPKGVPLKIDGWPELELFRNYPRSYLAVNGRMGATIGSPLGWDVASMREQGVLPGAGRKTAPVLRAAEPPGDDFAAGAWAAAEWHELGGIQLEETPVRCRFKALYDDDGFYVAVETALPASFTMEPYEHDGKCFKNESLDLTVDPTGTKDVCYHFVWNPVDGSVFDEAFGLVVDPLDPKFGQADRGWNSFGWKVSNRRSGDVWSALFALPYAELKVSPPKPGDRWCFNLGRQANCASGNRSDYRFALWSPDFETRSFNSRDALGDLIFR
ncbi:MAG: DUF4838 domain-containing protein [Kiritimatiellia bacterium]